MMLIGNNSISRTLSVVMAVKEEMRTDRNSHTQWRHETINIKRQQHEIYRRNDAAIKKRLLHAFEGGKDVELTLGCGKQKHPVTGIGVLPSPVGL